MVEAENFIKETEARLTRKNELIIRLETSKRTSRTFDRQEFGGNCRCSRGIPGSNIIEPDLEDNDLSQVKELNEERLEIAKE